MENESLQTIEGLRALLTRLDSDEQCAAEKYYRLIRSLTLYIEHRASGCIDSGDLARRTVDAVAARLAGGDNILNIPAYSFGVARNLLHTYREPLVYESTDDRLPGIIRNHCQAGKQESAQKEVEDDCRRKCLAALPEDQRALVVRYYEQGIHSKDYKSELAREMNTSTEALCNRISRIKKKLSACHSICLQRMRDNRIL